MTYNSLTDCSESWRVAIAILRARLLNPSKLAKARERTAKKRELSKIANAALSEKNAALPIGERKYAVIYADPAWRYEHPGSASRQIENHYPTMPLGDICALPVADIAAESQSCSPTLERGSEARRKCSALVPPQSIGTWPFQMKRQPLSAPQKPAPEMVNLFQMKRHGFKTEPIGRFFFFGPRRSCLSKPFKSSTPGASPFAAAWCGSSTRLGMGYYVRQRHELLLIGRRGDALHPLPADRPDSVIEAPRGKHSEKPAVVYDLLERMYPDLPKIELFSRSPREGWDAWGNQAP